jgi:hypothetical protein
MKAYEGVDGWINVFLISALVGGEWSGSRLYRFTLGERAPSIHRIGGWVDSQSRSGRYGEVTILYATGTRTPTPSVVQPAASLYTD